MGSIGQDAAREAEDEGAWQRARDAMVEVLQRHGIRDVGVLSAMAAVPRHLHIPVFHRGRDAYGDHPCPIGYGQTISQPYIVAYMTELLHVRPGLKVLDVGTGSGYQAAVLAQLGVEVLGLELIPQLADHARDVLKASGVEGVHIRTGDGYRGWSDQAPFDRIAVGCAPAQIPPALVDQLADGGRMVIPVGTWTQRLIAVERRGDEIVSSPGLGVRFVPMVHG